LTELLISARKTQMFKAYRKLVSDKVHEFVGSWAYFIGAIMADSFQERLDEIHNEECEECQADEGGPAVQDKPN
jgi:hypothetical protein